MSSVETRTSRLPQDTSAANDRSQFYAAGTFEDAEPLLPLELQILRAGTNMGGVLSFPIGAGV